LVADDSLPFTEERSKLSVLAAEIDGPMPDGSWSSHLGMVGSTATHLPDLCYSQHAMGMSELTSL